jgi:hypothetical protein
MCPECSEIFRFSDTFIRHHCKLKVSGGFQHRKKYARQKAKLEFERAIKLCETAKRKRITEPVLNSKKARLRQCPAQHSDPKTFNNTLPVSCNDNISFITNNNAALPPNSNDIDAIVVANNYNNVTHLLNNDGNFEAFIANNQNNTTSLLHDDNNIGAFFAANNHNNTLHLPHGDNDIGAFFGAKNHNNTAHVNIDNDIGAFFAGDNNNTIRFLTDDNDIGMFFAANQGTMRAVSTNTISVPDLQHINHQEQESDMFGSLFSD